MLPKPQIYGCVHRCYNRYQHLGLKLGNDLCAQQQVMRKGQVYACSLVRLAKTYLRQSSRLGVLRTDGGWWRRGQGSVRLNLTTLAFSSYGVASAYNLDM